MAATPTVNEQPDATERRQTLVDALKQAGRIVSPPVEAALRAVPRHLFLPDVPLDQVYQDDAIITKRQDGQAISSSSQPSMMAIMLEQLDLRPGQRVLEIGAGTGYNAALMAHLVGETGQVVSVDIDDELVARARARLAAAGWSGVQVVCADGMLGHAEAAPYDRIILTVAAWEIAPAWWEQLRPDGRLVLPLVLNGPQKSVAFAPAADHLRSVSVHSCDFMHLRGGLARPRNVIPLGPEPGLLLDRGVEAPRPVAAAAIYHALSGPSSDRTTPFAATLFEVLGGLALWLALYEPDMGGVTVEGAPAERGLVPALISFPGEAKRVFTLGVLGADSLALLCWSGDQAPAVAERRDAQPCSLAVRSYGPDLSPAQRLLTHLTAWDAAGRPGDERLHVRVYPRTVAYGPAAHEAVVEKDWTRLVVSWT